MTHSHDRTLLASIGFADPDKKDPMHDLACEYLMQPKQSRRIVELVEPRDVDEGLITESSIETVISKGVDQYRTVIGFLDVKIDWRRETKGPGESGLVAIEVKIKPISVGDIIRQISLYREYVVPARDFTKLSKPIDAATFRDRLKKLSSSEPIQSVAENRSTTKWVLATAFDIDAGQLGMLEDSGITSIRLGVGFSDWHEHRFTREKPKLEEF